MAQPRTGAERYLSRRLEDPAYEEAFERAKGQIGQIDDLIRSLDARRRELHLTKTDLARRAGMQSEAVRRLFSSEAPNPTLRTLIALASALDVELRPEPRRRRKDPSSARSAAL